MTPHEEINDALNRLPNNSAFWRNVHKRLTKLSRRDPQGFWAAYLEVINQPDPELRADVRELLTVNPDPTFADLNKFAAERNAVKQ